MAHPVCVCSRESVLWLSETLIFVFDISHKHYSLECSEAAPPGVLSENLQAFLDTFHTRLQDLSYTLVLSVLPAVLEGLPVAGGLPRYDICGGKDGGQASDRICTHLLAGPSCTGGQRMWMVCSAKLLPVETPDSAATTGVKCAHLEYSLCPEFDSNECSTPPQQEHHL
jgi:hypothetical protein